MLSTGGAVWISSGQWGTGAVLGFALLTAGGMVVFRAGRLDISGIFLVTYLVLLRFRILYLGQPIGVLEHQLSDGSLIIFAFFMLSDPRSTPDDSRGRAIFAMAVALLAYALRFWFYSPRALLLSLFLLSPLTPILDSLFRHDRFAWSLVEKTHYEKTVVRRRSFFFPSPLGLLWFLRRESRR
jgi:enediyne biosynthesis protein E5